MFFVELVSETWKPFFQLTVLRESPLSVVIGISGVLVGIVATVGCGFQINAYKDDSRNFVIAIFIGFAIGAGLALIGWFISRPFESLKPEQAQQIFDSTVERIQYELSYVSESNCLTNFACSVLPFAFSHLSKRRRESAASTFPTISGADDSGLCGGLTR